MSLLLEISIQDMTCVTFSFRSILTFLDEVEKAEDDAISEISQVGKWIPRDRPHFKITTLFLLESSDLKIKH